ncbi:MAG TPA: TIGR00269 family protein [Candidatus Thermoplasmatota archaeon]|nr:TIGR00269 family protein [Candidatus Thermoplasmatota archaeon]
MPPQACDRCTRPSAAFLRYSGQHLCGDHFREFTRRRVKREVRRQGPYPAGSRIAIGVSGGKDSIVALHLLAEVFRDRRDVELVAVSVDEGIEGYRPPALAIARRAAERLGVAWKSVAYRDVAGVTMDGIVATPRDRLPCAYCGVLRRRSLNDAAKAVGATHLATGHNLDDTAQTILMNTLKGDVERLARLGPHRRVQPGLVPRLMPLRAIPEREVALFAILEGLEYHDGECPYSTEATRGRYRDLLLDLEAKEPGTRHALVAGYDRMADLLAARFAGAADALRPCLACGEPASGATCAACALLAEVRS